MRYSALECAVRYILGTHLSFVDTLLVTGRIVLGASLFFTRLRAAFVPGASSSSMSKVHSLSRRAFSSVYPWCDVTICSCVHELESVSTACAAQTKGPTSAANPIKFARNEPVALRSSLPALVLEAVDCLMPPLLGTPNVAAEVAPHSGVVVVKDPPTKVVVMFPMTRVVD